MLGSAYIKQVVKSPTFAALSAFAGGNILCSIISGVGGLLQARWLDPAVFGEFQQYGILATYLSIGVIFANDGLIRQYPYYLGKGERDKALEIAGVAKWWYLLVSFVMSGIMLVLMLNALWHQNWHAVIGWGAWILISWMTVYGAYLGILYRTSSDFKRLAANNLLSAIWAFAALALVKFFGFLGLACRMSSYSLFNLFLNIRYLPVKVRAIRDFKKLKELSSISLKFALPAYLHANGLTATKNALILYYCAKEGLGIFSIAVSFQMLALSFSNSLNQIFNVKINSRFGQTEDIRDCFRYALKPALLGILVSVVLVVAGCIVIDPFIRYAVPKYVASIPVIQVLLVSLVTMSLNLPLLVIKASLRWKTAAFQAFVNFSVTVLLIVILPKTPVWVAVATIAGGLAETFTGYCAMFFIVRSLKNGRSAYD